MNEIVEVWCKNDEFSAVDTVDGESYCPTCLPFAVANRQPITVTKDDLVAAYRGGPKGKAHPGTLVRLAGRSQVHEISYLMTHQKGHYEDVVAVFVPEHRGLCFSVKLTDIVEVIR